MSDNVATIRSVTGAPEHVINDVRETMGQGTEPLPGTVLYNVWLCWRMVDEMDDNDNSAEIPY